MTQIINPIIDQKVENSGAVGEIDFKNEFTVFIAKADDKNPTAAVAKTTAGVFGRIFTSVFYILKREVKYQKLL